MTTSFGFSLFLLSLLLLAGAVRGQDLFDGVANVFNTQVSDNKHDCPQADGSVPSRNDVTQDLCDYNYFTFPDTHNVCRYDKVVSAQLEVQAATSLGTDSDWIDVGVMTVAAGSDPGDCSNSVSDWVKDTTLYTPMTPWDSPVSFTANQWYRSPSFADAYQSRMDESTASNRNVAIITHPGTDGSCDATRTVFARNTAAASAAKLIVTTFPLADDLVDAGVPNTVRPDEVWPSFTIHMENDCNDRFGEGPDAALDVTVTLVSEVGEIPLSGTTTRSIVQSTGYYTFDDIFVATADFIAGDFTLTATTSGATVRQGVLTTTDGVTLVNDLTDGIANVVQTERSSDCHQDGTGTAIINSNELNLCEDRDNNGSWSVYLVFPNVNEMCQGDLINDARVIFRADGSESGNDNGWMDIRVEKSYDGSSMDSPNCAASNNFINLLTTFGTKVNWDSPENWVDGTSYTTPDISALVQEKTDDTYYDPYTDEFGIIFTPNNNCGTSRVALSSEGDGAPRLQFSYWPISSVINLDAAPVGPILADTTWPSFDLLLYNQCGYLVQEGPDIGLDMTISMSGPSAALQGTLTKAISSTTGGATFDDLSVLGSDLVPGIHTMSVTFTNGRGVVLTDSWNFVLVATGTPTTTLDSAVDSTNNEDGYSRTNGEDRDNELRWSGESDYATYAAFGAAICPFSMAVDAFVTFRADATSGCICGEHVRVYMHAADVSGDFTETDGWVQTLPVTSSVTWDNHVAWANNAYYDTPSFPVALQEIINRAGRDFDDEVAVIIKESPTATFAGNCERRAVSANDGTPPELNIKVFPGIGSIDFDTDTTGGDKLTTVAWETVVIELLDGCGDSLKTGPDSVVNVTASVVEAGATLDPASAVVAAGGTSGTAAFELVLQEVGHVPGDYTFTFSAVRTIDGVTVTSSASTVKTCYDHISTVEWTVPPTDVYGATNFDIDITIKDVDGNTIATGPHAILDCTLAIGTNPGGTLAGTATETAVAGVASFSNLQIGNGGFVPGNFTLEATCAPGSAISSDLFLVSDSLNSVRYSTPPPAVLPKDLVISVTVDLIGLLTSAVVTLGPDSDSDVTLSLSAGTGVLAGTLTVAAVEGVAVFNDISVGGVGAAFVESSTFVLTATCDGKTVDSSTFLVFHPADELFFSTQPSIGPMLTGDVFAQLPVVEVRAAGSTVTSGQHSTLDVELSLTVDGVLLGSTTRTASGGFASGFAGLAVQGLGFTTPGIVQLNATSTADGVFLSVLSVDITVHAKAATLDFSLEPVGPYFNGELFDVTVQVLDVNGDVVALGSDASKSISLAVAATVGDGSVLGTNPRSSALGVASFTNIAVDYANFVPASDFTLDATCAGVTTGTSAVFTVEQQVASLSIATPPSTTSTSDEDLTTQPIVHLLDSNGVLVGAGTHSTLVVVASMATATGDLLGTTNVAAIGGVVTFADLAIGFPNFSPGNVHQLTFALDNTGLGIGSTTSALFSVTPKATQLIITSQPADGLTRDGPFSINVQAFDADGGLVNSGSDASLDVEVLYDASSAGTGVLSGTTTATLSSGSGTIGPFSLVMPFSSGDFTFRVQKSNAEFHVLTDGTCTIYYKATQVGMGVPPNPDGYLVGAQFDEYLPVPLPVFQLQDSDGSLVADGPDSTGGGVTAEVVVTSGPSDLGGIKNGPIIGGEFVVSGNLRVRRPGGFFPGVHSIGLDTQGFLPIVPSPDFLVHEEGENDLVMVIDLGDATSVLTYEVVDFSPQYEILGQETNAPVAHGPYSELTFKAEVTGGPSSTVYGTTVVTAVAGVVTFSGINFGWPDFQPGLHRLRISCLNTTYGMNDETTSSVSVGKGADAISASGMFGDVEIGNPLDPISATIFDGDGLVLTTGPESILDITISLDASSTGSGVLSAGVQSTTEPAAGGVVDWNDLSVGGGSFTAGLFVLKVSITTTAGSTLDFLCPPIAIYGLMDDVIFTSEPIHSLVRDDPFATMPEVTVVDANDDPVAGGSDSTLLVVFSVLSGTGQLAGASVTGNCVAGVFTAVDLTIGGAPFAPGTTFTLQADVGGTLATSATFSVFERVVSIVFSTEPLATNLVSGDSLTQFPAVSILDAEDEVIDAGPDSLGSIALDLSIASTGTWTGSASETPSSGIATWVAGTVDYGGFTSGTKRLTATFRALSVDSAAFTIYARATDLVWFVEPFGDVVEDLAITQPVVDIVDFDNNRVMTGPQADMVVSLAQSGTGVGDVTPVTPTATAAAGRATFAGISIGGGTFVPSANFEFTASTTTPEALTSSVASQLFEIFPKAHFFVIATQPDGGPLLSGTAFVTDPVVEVHHANGGLITRGPFATSTITVSLGNGFGSLVAGAQNTQVTSGGSATFAGLSVAQPGLTQAATFTLDFDLTSPAVAPAVALSSTTMEVHDRAAAIVFTTQPVGDRMDQDLATPPSVAVHDVNGNVITVGDHSDEPITLSLTGLGTLGGTATISAANGEVTPWTALQVTDPNFEQGSFTLTATVLGAISVTSNAFIVGGTAASLFFATQPVGDVYDGVVFDTTPIVHILDRNDSLITDGSHATLTIDLALVAANAPMVLGGTLSLAAIGGIASFSDLLVSPAAFQPSDAFQIEATTPVLVPTYESDNFEVFGQVASLSFSPSLATEMQTDEPFAPDQEVEILHSSGARLTSGPDSTLSITVVVSGALSLTATAMLVAFEGVATFSGLMVDPLTMPAGGTGQLYRLEGSVTGASGTSTDTTIHAVGTSLVFTLDPIGNVYATELLTTMPVVEIWDVNNNIVDTGPDSILDVELTLVGGPAGTLLLGTTTETLSAGSVTWTDLAVNQTAYPVDRTFALAASPTTLPFSTTSVTFDIFEAFVVGPIPATQTHSEPSVAGNFSFELILQPLADVTIALSANVDVLGNDMLVMDGVDGTANTSFAHELVFDGVNWSVPRTVSLTGIDNDIDEVNDTHVITVNTTILTTDTRYDRWTIPRPVVLIMDDDVVGITGPSQVNHTIENEDGGTSRFSLVLESEPISLVTISVSSTGSEYPNLIAMNTPTGSRFTFGPANWDVPLTATLRAIDNDLPKGTQEFDINIAVSSGDPSYDDMPVENLRVSIDDDDADKIPFIPEFDPIEIIVNSGQEVVNRIDWFFVNSTFFPIEEVRVNTPPAALSGFEEDETPSIAFRWSHSHHYGNLSFIASERIGKYVVYFTAVYAGGEMTTPSRPIIIDVQPTPTPEFRTISRLNGPAQGGSVVTITGNYFGLERENLTEVTFAGIPCQGEPSDLWQNIKTIVCTTSEASEFRNDTGPIFVKTSLGEASTGTRFIWTYNPDPEIHAVSQWSMGNAVLSPILIAGKNFGFQESDVNDVKFAGQSCETIVYINTSAMLCTPQQVTQPEIGPVEVFTESHGYVASEQDFRYLMPVVELVTYHRSIPSQSWVVTVAGRDFGPSPVTNVTFEGVDCLSFTELAPEDDTHRVECRMPIGWESNPDHPCVQVVSADGGLGVCAADIVHEYPLPTVTSISPSRMSVTDSGIEYITIHGHDFGLTADSFVNASMDTSRVGVRTPLFCKNGDAQWISPEEVRCLLPDTGLNAWSQDNKVHISAFVGLETQNGRGPRNTRFTFDPARYPPPVISDITPKVGSAVPLDVTLTGEFFGLLGNDSITIEFQGPYGFAKCLEPTWKSPEKVACKSPRFFDFNMTVDDNQDRTYPFRITVGDETSAIVDRGFEYQLQLNTPVLLSVAPTILPLEGGLGWIFAHQIDIQVFGYVGEFEQFATESSTEPIEFVTNICLSEDRCIVEEEDNAGRLRQMFNDTVDPGSAGGTNGTSGGDVDVPDVMVPEEPIEEEEVEEVYTVVVERGDCGANDAACLFEANGFPISTELRASLVKECEGLILCRAILVKFPPQPEEGLYSLTLERIDREEAGFDTMENVLFYTGGCVQDGKWGPSRTECRDCPKGGICTGGSSVAAAPGYWTPNPGSDYVVECYPQERCLGGANGDCAEGYDGEVCGRCADGYYLYAQVCKDCPPKLTVLIFLVVAATVWTFFCFVVYYVKKRTTLSFLVSFLMGVQILAAIGDMTPNKAPTWIQVPAWFLKLFMADFSFIVFDCWRYVPFWVYYLLGLAYSLAVIVLMYIVGKVFQGMRLSYYRNHGTKATYEERALYYRDRLTRAFSIGFQVIYLTLVTRGLEVLSCTHRVDGQWRLVVRQDVLCYEGDHWISGGVAIGILVLIGLGYPLGYLWFMLKYRHKETDPVTGIVSGGLWRNESFMERYNFGYSLFKREHEGFFFMEIAVLIGLAGAKAHLATHPRYQMGVPVLFFLMKLGLVIFYRPYEHVKFNLIQMLICLGAMTALCANWFYHVEWINHNVPSLMAFAVAALFGLAYVWLIFNIGVAIVAPPEEVGGTYLEDDISDDDFFTEIKEEMPAVIGASEVFQYGMMKSIDEQEALAGDSIYVLGPDGLPIEDEEGDYVLTRKEIARRRLDETYEPTLLEWVDIQFFDDDDYADEIAEILAEREAAMVNGISEQGRARRRSSMMSIDASFGIGDSDSDSENDSLSARTRAMSGGSEASHSMSFGDELDAEDEPNDETNAAGQIRATDSGAQSSSVPPLPVLEAVVDESHGAESGGNSGSPVAPGKGKMMKGKGKMMKGKGKMMKGKGKMGKGKFGKGKSP